MGNMLSEERFLFQIDIVVWCFAIDQFFWSISIAIRSYPSPGKPGYSVAITLYYIFHSLFVKTRKFKVKLA